MKPRALALIGFLLLMVGGLFCSSSPIAFAQWADVGCGPIEVSYNASCNKFAEPLDIACPAGQMLQAQSFACSASANNNPYRDTHQCVVSAACAPATQADLTATNQSPAWASSHTSGTSISFSASVSNVGGTSATNFPNVFQFCDSGCTSYNQSVVAQTHTLVAGGSTSISASHSFASAGSYYYRGCADSWTSAVSESNESNNCSAWTQISVVAPAQPNLTAGAVTPVTATAGTAVTLYSTLSNAGSASTVATFVNLFQIDNNADHASVYGTFTDTRGPIAAAGTAVSQGGYTFPTAGTWYVRVCADNNAALAGTITESSEADNCGAWTVVTVAAPLTATCSVSPTTAVTGQSVTWTAVPSGGTGSYTYAWSGTDSLTSSAISVAKTYATTGTKTASVTVSSGAQTLSNVACTNSVSIGAPLTPDLTATNLSPAEGTTITVGVSTAFQGRTNNVGSATATNVPNVLQVCNSGCTLLNNIVSATTLASVAAGGNGTVSANYTFAAGLSGTYYYRFCADNNTSFVGTNTESNEANNCSSWTTVTVTPAPVTATLSVSPTSVGPSQSATVTWSSTNAVSCEGTGFSTGNATSGSVAVSEAESATYAVTCYRSDYADTATSFVGNEWWSGGTQTLVYRETLHNNGQQGDLCPNAAGGSPWNVEYKEYPNRCGDAGCSLIQVTCYAVTGTTATVAKPASYNQGSCTSSTDISCYNLTYFRSGTAPPPPSGSWATATTNLTVSALPDLTAGSTAYTAQGGSPYVWVGQPFTFTSNASNLGTGATTNVPNVFWIENVTLFAANTIASLASFATTPLSGSYTFASPGTYNVRACADLTTGWGSVVVETDEGNNCGPWYTVNIAPAVPTGNTVSCNTAGTQATLSWSATPSASGYYVRVQKPTTASCPSGWQAAGWDPTNVCLPNPDWVTGTSITFPTTAGQNYPWWVHSSTAGGHWSPAASGNFTCANTTPTANLSSSPTSVVTGNASMLTWSSTNAGSCTGSGFSTGGATSGSVSTGALSATTPYQVSCGGAVDTETVTVTTPTVTIDAIPDRVRSGQVATLTWSGSQVTSCVGTNFNTGGAISGSAFSVPITTQTTYTVTCDGGTATDSVTVNVVPNFSEF